MGICDNQRIINQESDEKLIKMIDDNKIILFGNNINSNSNKNIRVNELFIGNKPIPMEIAIKAMKSICKIKILANEGIKYGTGFFLKISNSLKYLITNYHIIDKDTIKIEIEIWNKKQIELNLRDYFIKYFDRPKDITVIYINDLFELNKDIDFLDYDLNYIKGYLIYNGLDIFSLEHPFGKNAVCASGIIKEICDYEFYHNISTDNGSSGCPIILLNNNINSLQVIGIHKCADYNKQLNCGTFIGEIIKEINYELKDNLDNNYNEIIENNSKLEIKDNDLKEKISDNKNELIQIGPNNNMINIDNNSDIIDNYIIGEIDLENEKIFPMNVDIIYSYDEYMRDHTYFITDPTLKNEEEIKKCKISIDDELIPFSYYYEFKKKGKYSIKYSFESYLTNTSCMFYKIKALKYLDLSKFNTKNVMYMESMFHGCSSLKKINLSNFNTKQVINMQEMFSECSSLKSIDLSSFDTGKVINVAFMFENCYKLKSLNLSNFNTQNVIYMQGMFDGCGRLEKLDLSNFNTQNVIHIYKLFSECYSLKKVDISNFNTSKIEILGDMFNGCRSLKKSNILTKEDRIIKQFLMDYKPDQCNIY